VVNVAMWGKALKIIPRISREEWDALDVVSRWLIITRAAVFVMTAMSCGVGGLLAWRDGLFSWPHFAACLVGLVFAHATNNLLNDLTDHRRGIDAGNYYRSQYGPQPLEHGLLTQRQLWAYIVVSGLVALACGGYLVATTGLVTLALLGAGAFFVLFYTWPLKYIGLGEPSVILVWGPLMVGGTYFVVTHGVWSWDVVWVSLAYAAGPTTVLFGKHTDKLEQDREKRVRTLPVLLGERVARYATIGLWVSQYVILGLLIAFGRLTPALALVVLATPKLLFAARIFARPRPTAPPPELPPNVWPLYLSAVAFYYNRIFGALFLAGLLGEIVLVKTGLW
jgi:1,4-dihydroxy-2-naphthoate octaprenyltransferase